MATNDFETCRKNIEEREEKVKAFIDIYLEEAERKAREHEKGKAKGKLAGRIISIKNNICIKGKRATCASKMLENYIAPYNATVIDKLEREGAIIIGSCNMDEFACGSDTTHSAFYPTRNPTDLERVPGGSSGGSAASVSAGFAEMSLGSDTGGSIRCPATFCGVVGVKGTYGSVSRYGLIDMGMSLDQIGPVAKNVKDAALLFEVICGKDERDQVTQKMKFSASEVNGDVKKKRIGIVKEFFDGADEKISKITKDSVYELEKEGAIVEEVSIPETKYVIPIYYLLVFAEFSSAMQKYDSFRFGFPAKLDSDLVTSVSEARKLALGREVKRRILLGTYITMKEFRDAWYTKTLKARRTLKNAFEKALGRFDLLASPGMPSIPWKFGEKQNALEMYLADILTVSANLCGIPAGVVPVGKVNELPVSLQLHGRAFEEKTMFDGLLAVEHKGK